jgi:flagellar hook-associated protein 3 FlgL
MRTTFNAVNRHTKYVIERRYAELAKLQNKLSTGKELARPSDGAVDVANVIKLRGENKHLAQFEKNINDGMSWMAITDTTMASMNETLHKGRDLAIQGDNDTLSANERSFLAEEVQQLARQLISLTNSQYKGEYLFSGSHTDKPPVPVGNSDTTPADYTGNRMSFFNGTSPLAAPPAAANTFQIMEPNGSTVPAEHRPVTHLLPGSMNIKVAGAPLTEGVDYSIDYLNGTITDLTGSLTGTDFTPTAVPNPNYAPTTGLQFSFEHVTKSKDVYGNNINTDSKILREIDSSVRIKINTSYADLQIDSKTDMISSLIALGSALKGNDKAGINAAMDNIDTSFNRVLSSQSSNGAKMNLFESTLTRNEYKQIDISSHQSLLEDADYSEVVSDFSVAQTVFNAALQSTASIMQSSLVDFIR